MSLKHHIVEGANMDGVTLNGQPVPKRCVLCGEPALYGKDGVWSCASCWQFHVDPTPKTGDPA